tara:strand:- start:175 stop:453 length:279 start_codon:yes stop_codon:yes gene_type:complete
MPQEKLLRIFIRDILQENRVKLRTSKGYNASHPVVSKKPLTGFGDMYQFSDEPTKNRIGKKQKVKVSKAFDEDELEDLAEYERIIKEILSGE